MTVTDDLLANDAEYAAASSGPLPLPPAEHVAVIACMDARVNVHGVHGFVFDVATGKLAEVS